MQRINSRPVLKINKSWVDWLLIGLAISIVFVNLLVVVYYYPDLPNRIPVHFNANGEPDAYGSGSSVWVPLILNITLSWFTFWLAEKPQWLNYPYEVNADNARMAYTRMARVLRFIGLSLVVLMSYISLNGLRVAFGIASGIGSWLVPVMIMSGGVLLAFLAYPKNSKR